MSPGGSGWLADWWRRRTLRNRLSFLVAAAVAVAVLALAALAWGSVREVLYRQIGSELTADAQVIAAQPDQWRSSAAALPGPTGGHDQGHHGPHEVGPRWQLLDPSAAVTAGSAGLPVTAGARLVAAGQLRRATDQVTIDSEAYQMLSFPLGGGGAVQVAISEAPVAGTLEFLAVLLAGACALGVIGAALLGRVVARAGLRPVERLTEAVEEVAVTLDLTRPITISGADEIARLGYSVNTMLDAIGTARNAQRALVEDASHELRTPLTSIRTNIELLLAVERQPERADRLPPADRVDLLQDLDAQVVELAELTNELVELARAETTREATETLLLGDVVNAAVTRVRMRAPGLTFAVDLAPVAVEGRPAELERMVLNVLDNAAKWSPRGATVSTRLSLETPISCLLTISDCGPGIDAADRPHVFDRFYRSMAARAMPGSGLGLAIVAQTAAQHGGTVTVGPQLPTGTIVSIRLPSRNW